METKRVDCMKCRHFYVTWDAKYPKGCRAFGFKTSQLPSLAVFQSSGSICMKFSQKAKPSINTDNKGYYC
ncbi:hypothetical protein [Sutcliffiella halmapala]|uniref:hypothetical protein n=1 Tax=Sutcliffiella halmapala TaxID=79882 RepID=UPI0009953601|nr:hypothetical protein [Sutcliffiella halmapala]